MIAGQTIPAALNVADYFLDRHLREGRGGRLAVAGTGAPMTYAELTDRAARVAGAWRDLGLAAGERVLLVLPDSADFIACFFGTVKMGAVAVPVNPFTRAGDYAYYVADSKPRLAVVDPASFAEALPALQQAEPRLRVVTVEARAPGCDFLDDLLASARPLLDSHPTAADDVAFFLYTSGSGGQPKAAMHRHRHMLVTADCFARQVLGLRPDDLTFSASKLFFAYGLGNGMTFPLSVGAATVLLPERPTPEKLFSALEQYKPSLFFSVPTLYAQLLRAAEGTRRQLGSVRLAVSAGEALPAEIFARFRARFGREILDGIGTTEMLHMFMSNRPGEARPGSCGPLVPGYEARIVDEGGDDVRDAEVGNLWVRGGSTMAGYWEQPELTARVLRDDWYSTNDKFTRDSDGFYHYCGRADDMLKVGGMWVSPLEVENALLAHQQVAEAAVVGQHTEDGLTSIVAYVVLHEPPPRPTSVTPGAGEGSGVPPARAGESSPLSPAAKTTPPSPAAPAAGNDEASEMKETLRAFVRARLSGYKCPQRLEFVAELPKTATGKIQRFKLRS